MIDNQNDLDDFIKRALECDSIAIDTEFVWERTFYPCLGLIQAALPTGECVLIDPLAFNSLESLGKIIENDSITKIFHDSTQDLQILYNATGSLPRNIFDTRVAAGFAGMLSTISLQKLIAELLDINLPKGETRTNWLMRPLSDKQLKYAIDDVKHMHEIKDKIEKAVEAKGITSWLKEDLLELDNPLLYKPKESGIAYKKVKYFNFLNQRELGILRELAIWREERAIKDNIPRRHLIPDDILISLSEECPLSLDELENSNILYGKLKKESNSILKVIQKGNNLPLEDCPKPADKPTNRNRMKREVKKIKEYITNNIDKYNIDPQLIGNRAEFEEFTAIEKDSIPASNKLLKGWRKEFLNSYSGE